MPYYKVLDGWRGFSILCVLAAHMLPVGLSSWHLNQTIGRVGMSIFFTLSGFLIATTLLYHPNIKNFIIRRALRILPLAWAFLIVALPIVKASSSDYLNHFLFYENLLPESFTSVTGHYWSLCIEIQFYLFIGLLFALFKEKGLIFLIPLCLLFTSCRIYFTEPSSHVTLFRVDEIAVGCCLALVKENKLGTTLPQFFRRINPFIPFILLPFFCHQALPTLNYFRAYVAVTLVAATLYQEKSPLTQWLKLKILKYLAKVSYALYIIHPLTYHGWLGSGEGLVKYAKRPISFLLTFGFAHLSTFYYERSWIDLAKRLTKSQKDIYLIPEKSILKEKF